MFNLSNFRNIKSLNLSKLFNNISNRARSTFNSVIALCSAFPLVSSNVLAEGKTSSGLSMPLSAFPVYTDGWVPSFDSPGLIHPRMSISYVGPRVLFSFTGTGGYLTYFSLTSTLMSYGSVPRSLGPSFRADSSFFVC